MKQRRLLSGLLAVSVAGAALGHSRPETTHPADGAVLAEAPEMVRISFDEPIRLTMFRLSGDASSDLDRPGLDQVSEVEAAVPDLEPGAYRVEWRGLSADGHTVSGAISFEVE